VATVAGGVPKPRTTSAKRRRKKTGLLNYAPTALLHTTVTSVLALAIGSVVHYGLELFAPSFAANLSDHVNTRILLLTLPVLSMFFADWAFQALPNLTQSHMRAVSGTSKSQSKDNIKGFLTTSIVLNFFVVVGFVSYDVFRYDSYLMYLPFAICPLFLAVPVLARIAYGPIGSRATTPDPDLVSPSQPTRSAAPPLPRKTVDVPLSLTAGLVLSSFAPAVIFFLVRDRTSIVQRVLVSVPIMAIGITLHRQAANNSKKVRLWLKQRRIPLPLLAGVGAMNWLINTGNFYIGSMAFALIGYIILTNKKAESEDKDPLGWWRSRH
jgi:hypothetical protein